MKHNLGSIDQLVRVPVAVVGGFIGARIATHLSDEILQRVFGVSLLAIGIEMIFFK